MFSQAEGPVESATLSRSTPASASRPYLSVVIPAYNEAARIGATLDSLLPYLRSRGFRFEVLVVDDGSVDETIVAVEQRCDSEVTVISMVQNQGKGRAVRKGVERSNGEFILVTDADLSVPIEDLERLESYARNGHAIVCGSRGLAESDIRVRQTFYREQMGRIFNVIVRCLGLSRFRDTQCGFKLLRAREAREILSLCRIQRFAYDVELLFVARTLGFQIIEVPITWRNVPDSRVHPAKDAARMLWDVLGLRLRRIHWQSGGSSIPRSR
jgi:dolichyl-phosphate beta-glucosyltransferase